MRKKYIAGWVGGWMDGRRGKPGSGLLTAIKNIYSFEKVQKICIRDKLNRCFNKTCFNFAKNLPKFLSDNKKCSHQIFISVPMY